MIAAIDGLLRAEGRFAVGRGRVPALHLAAIVCACGAIYGAAMGTGASALQSTYSALKVPLLLVIATLVCLPNFYVLNTVLGLRDDFAAALRGILAAQATVAAALLALAPWIVFLYATTAHYPTAVAANGACFALATLAGQRVLGRHYEPLVRRDRRHAIGRAAWIALYVFVAIQLAWMLRPFVGYPRMPTTFFRAGAWTNAYVEVTQGFLRAD